MTRPKHLRPAWAFLAGIFVLTGCSGASTTNKPEPPFVESKDLVWFDDLTASCNLNFTHDPGSLDSYFMPQSMGSGCAFFDADGDGLLDIYLLHLGGPKGKSNQLFMQTPNGKLEDRSKGSGLDIAGYNHGVAIGDVNNDGKPDVVVTQYGGIKLFLNEGHGRFRDVTDDSGLVNPLWAMSAAFLDYDRDGWLDLVVANYLDYDPKTECFNPQGLKDYCGPSKFRGRPAKLYHNLGAKARMGVKFEDVSFASGLGKLPGPGLGVACADLDGDGWQDIFVANDGKPNRLWINQHDGTFVDEAVSRGAAYTVLGSAFAGMGIAIGDVAGTGMLDLFVTHLGTESHTLWRQGPRGQFRDQTAASGLLASKWRGAGFGTLFADFDLDGALDLAIVNGRVHRGGDATDPALGFWQTYAERNQLFAGDGAGKFRDISLTNPAFSDYWNVGRGLACGDFDNDGAPDLLVNSLGGKARLFRNVATNRGNWLKVRAIDPRWNRDAYGAEVRVRAGKKEWLRLISPTEGYLSSSVPIAHYGLGTINQIDSIAVVWPDGVREEFPGGAVNRQIDLRRGEGNASR